MSDTTVIYYVQCLGIAIYHKTKRYKRIAIMNISN